jgi:hypothetical protein
MIALKIIMAIRAIIQPARRRTDFEVFQRAHPDFVLRIHTLRKLRDREFDKLSGLTGKDQRNRVRALLTNRSLHLLYAYEALRKAKRLADASPDTVSALAARCNPFQRCDEPGNPLQKWTRGRGRLVMAYGPAKRMHQLLVADLLRHLHPPLEQQCLFRGGMPAAFRAVEAAYRDGFTYAAEIDVIDFYGSVRLEGLANLMRPLPDSVVRHVVWDGGFMAVMTRDNCVSVFMRDDDVPSPNVQRGIALGSACSPIVGERILATLIAPAEPCRIVAYADNMFVLGQSHEAVERCYEQMQQRASGFAGWALGLRRGGIHNLNTDVFEFLHHEGQIVYGDFVWSPDQRKLNDFLTAESDDALNLKQIATAERKVSHWRRAYPSWPDGDEWETRQLAALAARRFYKKATPLHRSHAAQALVSAYLSLGRVISFEEIAPTGIVPRDINRRIELIEVAEQRLVRMADRGGWDREDIRYRG